MNREGSLVAGSKTGGSLIYYDLDSVQKGNSIFFMGTELHPTKEECAALSAFLSGSTNVWAIQTAANTGGVLLMERIQLPVAEQMIAHFETTSISFIDDYERCIIHLTSLLEKMENVSK